MTAPRSDLASLRRAWALAGPEKSRAARGIFWRFAQSMLLGLGFATVIMAITGLSEGRALTSGWIWQITGLMAVSLIGQLICGYLAVRDSWDASFAVGGALRLRLLAQLRDLPIGFHLSRSKGDSVAALTSDMQMLEGFFSDGLPRIAQALGLPVVILLVLLWQDWRIALAVALPILMALPVFVLTSRHMAALGLKRQDLQAEAGAKMIEYVQGMAVIRAFNRTGQGQEGFRRALDAFRDISIRMVVQLVGPMAFFGLIVMTGVPLILWWTGGLDLSGQLPLAPVLTALLLALSAYAPILGLLGVMETLRLADASLSRMDRILTARPLPLPSDPRHPQGFALEFDGVGFGYRPGRAVLKDLSFTVPEGSMTAIVGPSGAGKSTILHLIARFWDRDMGRITIGGTDVASMTPGCLADLVTVVFQDVALFSGSVRDNIALARPDADQGAIEAAACAAQAHDFIMALPQGYETQLGEGGMTLSGGERQRLSIARAMLKNAPIVLMDEATAALDPINERAIRMALARLIEGRSLIVVAHRLSTIRDADQILVMDEGTLVATGRHDDLLSGGGVYTRLWQQMNSAAQWRVGDQ